jgi:hypothetical protein
METMEMPMTVPPHRLGNDIQQLNIDFSNVDLGSIQLPPGEDFGIKSEDEEEAEDSLEFETGFGNIVVVDNLPVVPPEKFEKLEGVVRKIFGQIGTIRERGLWMPIHPETQKTQGYCFIEYNTPQVQPCHHHSFFYIIFYRMLPMFTVWQRALPADNASERFLWPRSRGWWGCLFDQSCRGLGPGPNHLKWPGGVYSTKVGQGFHLVPTT